MKREFPKDIKLAENITSADILNAVCEHFEVNLVDVWSKLRIRSTVEARHTAITFLHYKGVSNADIAKMWNMTLTLSNDARKAVKDKYETDHYFAA